MPSSDRFLLLLLAFGNFIIGMGAFVVIGIISPIADGLGVSKASAGMVLTTYAFAYAILSPLVAALTGQVSRRAVLLCATALFLAGNVASALSHTVFMLSASRIVVALGGALFTPIAAGVAVAISAPETRGKALATVFGGVTLAQVIGVPMGAWLAYRFGWAAAFWTVSALAAIGCATLAATVPRDIRFQASTMATVLTALKDLPVMFATAFTATFIAAIYIVFTFFGPIIEASVGSNPEIRTFYLVLFGVGAVLGNILGGILNDRIGSKTTLVVLCLGQAVIMPLFSVIPWNPAIFAAVVGLWSSFGWSFMAPQQARLVVMAPAATALVLALNAAMIYVGITIGSGVGSAILQNYGLAALGIAGGIGSLAALGHLLLSGRSSRVTAMPEKSA